jgi:hypothetical protein
MRTTSGADIAGGRQVGAAAAAQLWTIEASTKLPVDEKFSLSDAAG